MGLNARQVRVALSGRVLYDPDLDSPDPTDLAVPSTAIDLGYTTEDGVTFNFGREVEDIMGWQSMDPLRKLITAEPRSASFSLRQMAREQWLATMGGSISQLKDAGTDPAAEPALYRWEPDEAKIPEGRLYIDMIDGDATYRFGFRRAQNSAEVEFSLVRNDSIVLPNEWTALATGSGKKPFFMDTNDPAFAPTAP